MTRIALIPARKGSRRLANKNFRVLGDRPLIQWTIDAALEAGFDFRNIYLCTDAPELARQVLPSDYSSLQIVEREEASDEERDIEWVSLALTQLQASPEDEVYLLRPTSPFRDAGTIQRAAGVWEEVKGRYDSMRAIRKASESPWKMWRYAEDTLEIDPITSVAAKKHLHSFPTQLLEEAFVQTAGLELFPAATVLDTNAIAGNRVAGFLMAGPESLDINTPQDWEEAERIAHDLLCPTQRFRQELGEY